MSNALIYGRRYGSGFCYCCTSCGAYVGTHEPQPKKAYGILGNEEMRRWKIKCHALFDACWKGKKQSGKLRDQLYRKLADQMEIPMHECHFGYFDMAQLKQAYDILKEWRG